MSYTETDDAWRLYRREWVIAHTTDTITADDGKPSFDQAMAYIKDNLKGRLRDDEINIEVNTDAAGHFWAHVITFKDNLKGEFKNVNNARGHAMAQGYDEYTIVPRNSKSDHDIRSYGVKML